MLKMIAVSFGLALQNIRDNFFHTILSVLGIVIGVAALVAILSFVDGIEKYAREQISATSSLHSIMINTNTSQRVDGIRMEKEAYGYFTYEHLQAMEGSLKRPATAYLFMYKPQVLNLPQQDSTLGISLIGTVAGIGPKVELLAGRLFTEEEVTGKGKQLVVNDALAKKLSISGEPADAVGQRLEVNHQTLEIVGVVKAEREELAQAFLPVTHFSDDEFKKTPPFVMVEALNVEDVSPLKEEIELWLKEKLARQEDDFRVMTNEYRLKQFNQAFLIFKLVMGMITGIAVLVGGIGIMNVLLISVTERTAEIGIRKAVGAKKRDIILLFLSESVTVSSFGSLLGLILGVLGTMIAVPVVQHLAEAPFEAAYTLGTMLLVALIAVLLGVVFGTYPALRAAGLDPVEAIRRE